MKSRVRNAALACSMLAAVAIAALWVRGVYVRDQVVFGAFGHKCAVAVFPQHLYFIAVGAQGTRVPTDLQLGLRAYPGRPRYWEIQYHDRPGGALRLGIPFWLPLSFAIIPPLWWVLNRTQAALRYRAGRCRACGYDLRASSERCPECGASIEHTAGEPASSPSLT